MQLDPRQQLSYETLDAMLAAIQPSKKDLRADIALDLLRTGWVEGRKRALAMHKKIWDAVAQEAFASTIRHDTSGFEVDLDRYLTGEPECMFEIKESPAHTFVDIWVSLSISGMVDQETIFRRGAAILALIDGLEHGNKRVALTVCLTGDRGAWTTVIKIKEYEQRLDIDKLAVIFCHENFLRGILFSVWASIPGNENNIHTVPCYTPHPEKDCVYVGHMLGTDSQWATLESCQAWVLAEIKKQGIS